MRVQGLERVRLIAVGAFHNLALLEDGILWAWGNNEYGQLGTGDTQPRAQPIPVQGLSCLTLVCITISDLLLFIFSMFIYIWDWWLAQHGFIQFHLHALLLQYIEKSM